MENDRGTHFLLRFEKVITDRFTHNRFPVLLHEYLPATNRRSACSRFRATPVWYLPRSIDDKQTMDHSCSICKVNMTRFCSHLSISKPHVILVNLLINWKTQQNLIYKYSSTRAEQKYISISKQRASISQQKGNISDMLFSEALPSDTNE